MTEQRCECPSTNHGHKPNECHKAATREDKRCDACREAEAKEATDDVRRLAGAGRIFFAYCKTCKEGEVPLYELPDAEKVRFRPPTARPQHARSAGHSTHIYHPKCILENKRGRAREARFRTALLPCERLGPLTWLTVAPVAINLLRNSCC